MTNLVDQPNAEAYDEITHLGGLAHIRHRPGMYVGDFHSNEYNSAPMNLLSEAVGNSNDEFMNGHATKVTLEYDYNTNVMRVTDDGRGIPFGPTVYEDPVTKIEYPMDKLELATCVPNSGAKYDKGDGKSFKFSIGLNGIGIKAINALSDRFFIQSRRDGVSASLTCAKGVKQHEDVIVETAPALNTALPRGTTVEWVLDPSILPFKYTPEHLRRYLHQVAYLNAGLALELNYTDAQGVTKQTRFHEPDGLQAFARKLAGEQPIMLDFPPMAGVEEKGSKYEIVMKVLESQGEVIHAYVNGGAIETASSPVAAMRQAYARAVSAIYKDWPKLKKFEKLDVRPEDFRTGMLAILKILHVDPAYDAQTKTKLINTDVSSCIQQELPNQIKAFMLANPQATQMVMDQAIKMATAREAAAKARENSLKESDRQARNSGPISLDIYTPPLLDDPENNAIYMFEGQSASGSLIKAAKQRNPDTGKLYKDNVGILALKGNVLNALEADMNKAMKNVELATLVQVSGLNRHDPSDLSKLKYSKFIIATDMDAGGSHICTLLVSFFLAHFPEVIRRGMLYRVITPLFEVADLKKKVKHFIYHDEDKDLAISGMGFKPEEANKKYTVKRNKGLGEMSDEANMTLVHNPRLQSFQTDNLEAMRSLYYIFSGKEFIENRRAVIFERGLLQGD